jgi:ABC-type transport system substrate-binding protein
VLHLRSGVKFQDGTDFNADAVKQHLERGINVPTSTVSDVLSDIESIETPDDMTVVLHLSSPRAGVLPTVFTERAGQIPSPAAVTAAGDTYGADEAVGAGPYAYDSHTPSTDIHVTAWDGYWDVENRHLAGIDMLGSAEEFQIERISSGEVDYASMKDVQLPEAESAKAAGDIDFRISPTDQYAEVYINWTVAPFDDVRVRQALNMAIDRELLVEALTNGSATPATSPIPSNSWAYAPDTADLYPYDPERATELLAEAGYPDGVDVTVGMIEHPYYTQLAQAVQDMVAESGFRFSLETVTGSEINNRLYELKNLPVAITAFRGSSDPGITLEQKFSSGGNSNPAGTTADGVDALLAEGAASAEPDDRVGAYQEAQLAIMEDALSVPIFHNGGLVSFSPEVKGVQKGYTTCQFGSFVNDPIYFEASRWTSLTPASGWRPPGACSTERAATAPSAAT